MSVPHVRQSLPWDCGVACVAMILSAAGMASKETGGPVRLEELLSACPSTSIWTIDLAYLLRYYGVDDFTYYTSYIGVNWRHAPKAFYKESISQDRARVHALFATAVEHRVRIAQMILALDDAKRFLLSARYAIVVLVNLALLKCRLCAKESKREWKLSGRTGFRSSSPVPSIPPPPQQSALQPQPFCNVYSGNASNPYTNNQSTATRSTHSTNPSTHSHNEWGPFVISKASMKSPPNSPNAHLKIHNNVSTPAGSPSSVANLYTNMSPPRVERPVSPSSSSTPRRNSSSQNRLINVNTTNLSFNKRHSHPTATSPTSNGSCLNAATSVLTWPIRTWARLVQCTCEALCGEDSCWSSSSPTVYQAPPSQSTSCWSYVPCLPSRTLNRPESAWIYSSIPAQPPTQPASGSSSVASSPNRKPASYDADFVGHYIVLVAYDSDRDIFWYRDPGANAELCCVKASILEQARGASGTDWDAIVAEGMIGLNNGNTRILSD
ncbi:hypothetical protein SeMB42_g02645 [Synchytrium endobioticum]|uniref:Uncharacterized protein n=1 Tax=Synchytrium endobioticum TaxID=286115 RepID=A0A507D856_9FUNG|nr:hypothetical protein SeLEV6574_g02538 [Synchytrium endobioticum]TPX49328.1 hypothetical protein SeMB42_g02645 [Synchytrium endobioticum]